MSFVHGHARATGWVVAHRRHPHRAEHGQLPLLAAPRGGPSPPQAQGSVRSDVEHPVAGAATEGDVDAVLAVVGHRDSG